MTHFEAKGVEIQYNSRSAADSKRRLAYSCSICCATGKRIDCDRCAINYTATNIQRTFVAQGERRMSAMIPAW